MSVDSLTEICASCVLSGFRCDGYPAIPKKRDNGSPPSDEASPDSPTSDDRSALTIITPRSDSSMVITPTTGTPATSTAVSPLVVTPTEPYISSERESLRFFIDVTASMIARSRVAPYFWKKLVPQAAWSYPSVRHAVLASSISSQALLRQASDGEQKAADLKVLVHSTKAVQSLLSDKVPLDVVLLTSAIMAILDLFKGEWDTACTHVTHGAKLARMARKDPHNEPFIAFYCEAFASALPQILKNAQEGQKRALIEKNGLVRLDEALRSLRLANLSFDETLLKLLHYQGPERNRIITMIQNAKAETDWVLPRWEALYREELQRTSPPDEDVKVNIHRIESPFSAVMANLNEHLDNGGPFDFQKFEVTMERTMPFYTCAKAGPHLKMRQIAVQLMRLGEELRGDRGALPSTSPIHETPVSRILEEDDES